MLHNAFTVYFWGIFLPLSHSGTTDRLPEDGMLVLAFCASLLPFEQTHIIDNLLNGPLEERKIYENQVTDGAKLDSCLYLFFWEDLF